ncbi:MAG: methionyl-tRNA formyltransferase, partial [Pseudomonadota bacterium]
MPLRIIFMGTPEFAVPSLVALANHGHEIVACYSQPPRPAGRRGLELKKSPVHETAEQLSIPVFTPTSFKGTEDQAVFKSLNADVAVVIAYGMLLPDAILSAPKLGCFNGHASLLPRWRGAAPIQRAIMSGDAQSGVCIMKMDTGLDTGPVALEDRMDIAPDLTAGELHDALSAMTARLMVAAMTLLENGTLNLSSQPDSGIEYAQKISKDETRIDWAKSANEVHNHVRGLSPFPGAWCEMGLAGKSQRVKILATTIADGSGSPGSLLDENLTIACGANAVRVLKLQRASKQVQS